MIKSLQQGIDPSSEWKPGSNLLADLDQIWTDNWTMGRGFIKKEPKYRPLRVVVERVKIETLVWTLGRKDPHGAVFSAVYHWYLVGFCLGKGRKKRQYFSVEKMDQQMGGFAVIWSTTLLHFLFDSKAFKYLRWSLNISFF